MKTIIVLLLIPLAASQIPFNILNIPPQVRDPLWKTFIETTKVDTQCFRDIKHWALDVINAYFAAQRCKSVDCLMDQKITNASYAVKEIASIARPHSLNLDELSLTFAGDHKLCTSIEGPYETKYCYAHISVDYTTIDPASFGIKIPGGKIPSLGRSDEEGDRCQPNDISNIKIAMCIPASCEEDKDVGRILSSITNDSVRICGFSCPGSTKEHSRTFYAINGILIAIFVIAVVASIFDYISRENDKDEDLENRTDWKLLMSFSILRNSADIFTRSKDVDSIMCLEAIRFITFTWIVAGHAMVFIGDGDNGLQVMKVADQFISDLFLNFYSTVDTFLVLSGLLKQHRDPDYMYTPLNWILFYVHRWMRLTPAYLLFIGFYVSWTPQIHDVWASGIAQNLTQNVINCEQNWWKNILYINNFGNFWNSCYPISWFLAVDTQFYFTAPIFLVTIYLSWKWGLTAIAGTTVISVIITTALIAHYDLTALGYTVLSPVNTEFGNFLYTKPWSRSSPFFTGVICGYLIVQVRTQTIKMRRPKIWELAICWTLSTVVALAVIFAPYDYIRGASEWSIGVRSLYFSFSRFGWSAAIAWVVLACTFDWAGPVKRILEHPIWYPLGRLTYCAYIVHFFAFYFFLDSDDRPTHFVSLRHTYLSVTIPVVFVSYLMAFVLSCLVEIPFTRIETIVVDRLTKKGGHLDTNVAYVTRSFARQGISPKEGSAVTAITIVNEQ